MTDGADERGVSPSKRVVVLISNAYGPEHIEGLRRDFPEVHFIQAPADGTLPGEIEETRAILRYRTSDQHMRKYLEVAPNVEWIQSASAGFDHWVLPEMVERKIVLTKSASTHNVPIAEMVVAFILQMAKRLPAHARAQAAHEWVSPSDVDELGGRVVGIVGAGAIGKEVAWRCDALGMRVIGLRRTPTPLPHFEEIKPPTELPWLLQGSDYVVLAAPSTDATIGLIGRSELETMKTTAYLINVARGSLVVMPDLVNALKAGTIAGACLDALTPEPLPPDSEVWDLPNVVITPHCSGLSSRNSARSIAEFKDNLRRFLHKEELANRYVADRGY